MNNSPLERTISPADKVFFLHIPKTAGISFNIPVSDHFDYASVCQHYFESQLIGQPRNLFQPYQYLRGHFYYSLVQQLVDAPLIGITMLRSPVKRFISHFNHWQRGGYYGLFASPTLPPPSPQMTLAEFADHDLGRQTQNLQTAMLIAETRLSQPGDPSKIEIASRGTLNQQTAVDLALARLDSFAFFGFTERFQESLYLLSYVFGWLPLFEPPRFNVAAHPATSTNIPPAVTDKIASLNQLDSELYRRANVLFEARLKQMTQELLERYGGKAHANLTYPLRAEVMRELLEAHYQRRFAQAHPSQTRLNLRLDQAISGTGWHPPDVRPPYGPVRWTGPGTRSTLDLPLAVDHAASVSFCVIEAMSPDILKSLKLYINDEPIPLVVKRDEHKAFIFEGYVPVSVLSKSVGYTRLTFETNRTLALSQLKPGHPETRPFGLQIAWVKVEPAEAVSDAEAYKFLLDKQGDTTRETLAQLAATESQLHDLTHSRVIQWAMRLRAFIQKLRGASPPPTRQ